MSDQTSRGPARSRPVQRRDILKLGSQAAAGCLAGSGLLEFAASGAAAAVVANSAPDGSRNDARHRSVIMVYLSGGIAHQDTFDLKPQAPVEVRGEFNPISTTVPGTQFCELLPKLASVADRCTILRSVIGQRDEHSSFQNVTGFTMGEAQRNGIPHFGSIVSRIQGATDPVTPPFVDLFPTMQHRPYNSPGAGYLGSRFNQVRADGEDLANMQLRFVNSEQFDSRMQLLDQLDLFGHNDDRRLNDLSESYRRACEVLTSGKLVEAMDVEREDPALRRRYGEGSPKHLGDGAPMWNDQLLVARRLVEAGVRVVTVAYGFWDTHGNNFRHMRQHLPLFDTGISALIQDLQDRGMDRDCTLIVWGEFGRTPKINKDAGRDHWAPVQSVLMAGGGMPMGMVIGSTDATAAYAEDRPIHYRDVLATIYHNLGIDTDAYIRDLSDRPVRILPDDARPVRELLT